MGPPSRYSLFLLSKQVNKVEKEYNRHAIMSGLEEVGVPGPDHLREALTNCTDPLAAIEEFQVSSFSTLMSPPALDHRPNIRG